MKQIIKILLMLVVLTPLSVWAQAPQKINYQAVVRNESGILVTNKTISIKITITEGVTPVTTVFSETRRVTTDGHGLFTIEIGDQNSISNINWYAGDHVLKVDVASEGGTKYNLHTTQELLSVPYALYAHITDTLLGTDLREKQIIWRNQDTIFLTGGSFVKLPQIFDGDYNHLTNRPTSNSQFANDAGYLTGEVQQIWISNDTLYLTGGSYVKIPAGFSGSYTDLTHKPTIPNRTSQFTDDVGYITNEVQVLSISNDTVFLTGGSYVKLPHYIEAQDLSAVAAINDSAFTQLKNIVDPTDPQDAVTKRYMDSVMSAWTSDTVDRSSHNVLTVNACDTFYWHGNTYSTPGTYLYQYQNEGGYYSVDTLHLTVRVGTYNVENVVAAGSYTWHDTIRSATGQYLYHYYNMYGCPSVDTLHLTIQAGGGASCTAFRMPSDTNTLNVCDRIIWYHQDIRSNGIYEHSLGTIGYRGCDSVVRVNVVIRHGFQQDTAARGTDSVYWRGQWYSQQGNYSHRYTMANGCDSVYTLHFMIGGTQGIGSAPGLYSVGANSQVRFASGNLQYQSSTDYWQFAKHQYDVMSITCMAPFYPSWSDKFGWATSGYHDNNDSLNTNYKPWDHDNTSATLGTFVYDNNQYGYGPSRFMTDTNLSGTSAYYDWGMYNPIVNGGNGAGLWHLLTQEQWNYLLNQRTNAASKRGLIRIRDIPNASGSTENAHGYVILSDNWTAPSGITFNPNGGTWENDYSLTEWDSIEAHGAIFLPMIGDEWNCSAFYWTKSSGGSGGAYALSLGRESLLLAPYNRSNSYCVRLAQDYVVGVPECNCTYYDTNIICNGSFSWHGYSYNQSGDYMEAIANVAGCDSIITLSLMVNEPGVLNGLFSVSSSRQVRFSKANLQYKSTADIWRFGNYQYDYVGAQNKYASPTYTGWLDLFSWGVSGYHDSTDVWTLNSSPAVRNGDHGNYGPSINMRDWSLINTSREYDWGIHDAIANGGNTAGLWRTLTKEEWKYLLTQRSHADSLKGYATVNGVRGVILLPDNWTLPSGQTFFPLQEWDNSFTDNVYDTIDWPVMETAGAVFLPAAGYKEGETVNDATYLGAYWTTTCNTYDNSWGTDQEQSDESHVWTNRAWHTMFYLLPRGGTKNPNTYNAGWDGWVTCGYKGLAYSVRLVKDY